MVTDNKVKRIQNSINIAALPFTHIVEEKFKKYKNILLTINNLPCTEAIIIPHKNYLTH